MVSVPDVVVEALNPKTLNILIPRRITIKRLTETYTKICTAFISNPDETFNSTKPRNPADTTTPDTLL